MAECLKDIVKTMAEGLKDIGKSIITQCLWPPIKSHIDYWWCFDNNIQVLRDGVRDLERETLDTYQKIEDARLHTDKLRPGVEEWSKAGTEKLGEARRILEDDINPEAWNLISRYSIGKRAKKAAEDIKKHQNDGNFNVVADPAPPPAMGCTTNTSIMEFESRKRIEEDIIESLKESSVSMIGICGMGGVGKTTMAQRIKERAMEEKEKEKLFDEVVMVVVSQPIDILKIQKEVAESLGLKFDVNEEGMPARAYKLCTRLMDTKRKIIIFDDVWDVLKLKDLGVPSGFERCKILLTTRSKDVCKNMKVQKTIPIEILTEEEAWILFKRIAGDCVEGSVLHSVAKNVVAECKGLPLALETVGMALQNKEISNWNDALSQLKRSNPKVLTEVRINVYHHLKLSYDNLDYDCERFLFLLCCLFPEDYDIPVEELTLYFMGLRKFDDDDITCIKEARNRIHTLVGNLKSRFLLIDGGKKHHVKMHDVVRDVAIFIGSKEKYGFLRSLHKISIGNSSDINCNWMSVDVPNQPMNVNMGLRFPKLRLLMLHPDKSSKGIGDLDVSFEGIGDLDVLSFSDILIGSLPTTLGLLQNLKTLCLYRCWRVQDISVIGELAGLEILYCNYCYEIKELPAEIGRLNSLRLLALNQCFYLRRIPFGILSSLARLEELKMLGSFYEWEAEENGEEEKRNASLRELESLSNLTCLEIHISDSKLAAQEIRLSQKLVKCRIVIGSDGYCGEASADYEKVMKLVLPRDIGAVGEWIQNLVKNTEYLRLEEDGSTNINLQQCQDLRYLEIRDCSTLKKVVKTKDCKSGIIVFPMLERLTLYELDNLEEIWDGTIILNQNNVSSLSNLKTVLILNCSKLRSLFSVSVATKCLLQLEELTIRSCSAMEEVFRNEMTDGCIEFPKLKRLTLSYLPNLTAFCQGFESIKFPNLTHLWIEKLPKMGLNSETGNNDTNSFHLLCNPKVEFDGLKDLMVKGINYNNIRNTFCHQIPINFFNNLETLVIYNINGIRSLMSYSIAKNLVNLQSLKIKNCEELVEVIEGNDDDKDVVDIHDCPVMETFTLGPLITPKLKELRLVNLPNLTSFCEGVENIKFPQLTYLQIGGLPKMNSFCPLNSETPHDDDRNPFHFLCNPKVEIDALRSLKVERTVIINNNIRNIWCHQIPINFFNNLENLVISRINGIRSLMPYSIAKNLVSLRFLKISVCDDMVEVIEGIDDDKQVVDIKCLFPSLKTLCFELLRKLRMFWQWNHALELPLLEAVSISYCRVMETFTLGSLKAPNFERLKLNDYQTTLDIEDLNDTLNRLHIKNQNTSMDEMRMKMMITKSTNENVNEDENENKDANKEDKDENNIKYNNENVNKEKDVTERK